MTRTIVIVGFLVAFAAGLVVGLDSRRKASLPTTRPGGRGGWLSAELNLTPQQQEQLKSIWSETASRGGGDREDRRRRLFRQRDEAIAALIRPEDKPRYDAILQDFAEKMAALDREWRSAFDNAVERTKQILTPEQQAKYEEMLQRHQRERGPHDRRRGDREWDGGRPGNRRPGPRPGGPS